MNILEVSDLKKVFGQHIVLDQISFNIPTGSFTGLLGPNGSGKTTIMKCIAGLIPFDEGEIRICGVDSKDHKSAFGHVTAIIGNPVFPSKFTPNDIFNYVGSCYGLSSEEIKSRSYQCLEEVHMLKWADKPVGSFSKGMIQRIAIAQALLPNPELIILDEPTSGLDPRGISEVRDLLRSLKNDKRSMLICSHILDDITKVCDSVLLIKEGRIVKEGNIDGLLNEEFGTIYRVKTKLPIEEDVIEKIGSIQSVLFVRSLSQTEMLIKCKDGLDISAEISEIVVMSGAGLMFVGKEKSDLEDLYLKVTDNGDIL